tara:strand:+ start:341 stop:919 length:579 start_codon:yes stop_codon:yes gene_type:complete
MILDYPYVEVYLPNEVKDITKNYIKRNRFQIIREFRNLNSVESHEASIKNIWDKALENEEYNKESVKGIKDLANVLIWEQHNLGIDIKNKTLKIINPENIVEEMTRRNLHYNDVFEKEKEHLYNFTKVSLRNVWNKKAKANWNICTYLTKFIIEFDNNLLELPKDKGVRWDIDKWRKEANIKVKQSWEEEKD